MQSVIVNSTTSRAGTASLNEIRLDMTSPLTLCDQQLSLGYLGIFYSWRNIKSIYNNNQLKYIWVDGVTYNVNIDDGFYSIEQLSLFVQSVMLTNGHYVLDSNGSPVYFIQFQANIIYYLVSLSCLPVVIPAQGSLPTGSPITSAQMGKVPQFVVPSNNITTTLGIVAGTYPPTSGTTIAYGFKGQNVPAISPVNTVNIACNITRNNLNQYKSIIYSFSPTKPYGSYLEIQPAFPIFYSIINGTYDHVSLTFVDQNYNAIELIDINVTATLLIKSNDK